MAFSTGIASKNYISAIPFLDKREILKAAVDIQNEEGLTDILQLAGKMEKTVVPAYTDFTEDPLWELLDSTGATVTGSGTPTVTSKFTVATSGYAAVNDIVLFPNGKSGQITVLTTASSQDSVTIVSTDGTNLTHVAGDKLAPYTLTVGENSIAPKNKRMGWTRYQNYVQTFRDVNEITDVANASEVEIEYNGQNYVFNRDIANKFIKFKGGINATLIAGRQGVTQYGDTSPANVDPAGGGAQQFTMGMYQYITTYGVNTQCSSLGTVALADLTTFINALIAARSPNRHYAWSASSVMAPLDAFFKNLASSGVTSARLMVDGKELDFDVNKITYMGFTFQFGVLPILNHPVHFSQTPIVKDIFFIPEGKVATKLNGAQDRLKIRYQPRKEQGLGNEIYQEWDSGALARGGAIGDGAFRRTNWISTQGLQMLGAQQAGILRVLA